jgi:hypothetical protein
MTASNYYVYQDNKNNVHVSKTALTFEDFNPVTDPLSAASILASSLSDAGYLQSFAQKTLSKSVGIVSFSASTHYDFQELMKKSSQQEIDAGALIIASIAGNAVGQVVTKGGQYAVGLAAGAGTVGVGAAAGYFAGGVGATVIYEKAGVNGVTLKNLVQQGTIGAYDLLGDETQAYVSDVAFEVFFDTTKEEFIQKNTIKTKRQLSLNEQAELIKRIEQEENPNAPTLAEKYAEYNIGTSQKTARNFMVVRPENLDQLADRFDVSREALLNANQNLVRDGLITSNGSAIVPRDKFMFEFFQ